MPGDRERRDRLLLQPLVLANIYPTPVERALYAKEIWALVVSQFEFRH